MGRLPLVCAGGTRTKSKEGIVADRFVLNSISYHGSGAIKEIPGELQRRGYDHVFVSSDPDLVKFGVTSKEIGRAHV